jgi:hypothetical protein
VTTVHRNGSVSINGTATGWMIRSWSDSGGKWFQAMLIDGSWESQCYRRKSDAIDYIIHESTAW